MSEHTAIALRCLPDPLEDAKQHALALLQEARERVEAGTTTALVLVEVTDGELGRGEGVYTVTVRRSNLHIHEAHWLLTVAQEDVKGEAAGE